MKRTARELLLHGGVFLGILAILWLALTAAAAIPNEALRENFLESARSFEGSVPYPFHGERLATVGDDYADVILLGVAWNMGEGSPLRSALDTKYYKGGAEGLNAGLYYTVADGAAPDTDYTRYWHGSAAVVRLLHLFTGVQTLRILGLVAVLMALALTAWALIRRGHWDLALLLTLSLAAVELWNIRYSMEYQPAILLALLLCPLYLWGEGRSDRMLTCLSVAGGTAVAFFDFLTTETLTILLPLLLVAAVRRREAREPALREELWLFARCGVGWVAAYGAAFLVKWTAASLVTGKNAFAAALTSVFERVGTGEASATEGFMPAVTANLTVLFGGTARVQPLRVLIGLAMVLAVLGSVWYLARPSRRELARILPLLLLGAVVPLRYLVLNNHSYLHQFFTYRALAAPIFALLASLRLSIAGRQTKKRR